MEKEKPQKQNEPKDPKLPVVNAEYTQPENSTNSMGVIPIAAPWIIPPDWPEIR